MEIQKFVVLSDEQIVYEVNGNELIERKNKSIEEYSVLKCGVTYRTFPSTVRVAEINFIEKIGEGGFGKVYKVFFQTQYYAIKKNINNRSKHKLS